MVGQTEECVAPVLDEDQLKTIVEKALGVGWNAKSCEVRGAAEGLTGFLGDHFRAEVRAEGGGRSARLHLFVKTLPRLNRNKADFIVANNFFRREQLMFQLFEEIGGDQGPKPWRPTAYLYSDSILVMPDLAVHGYAPEHFLSTLELPRTLLVAESVARLHAGYLTYATSRTTDPRRPYNVLQENPDVLHEATLCDSPWLRAAAKLSTTILQQCSNKYKGIPDLEAKVLERYLEACDSLREYSETLNVTIHRDLWINNILFNKDHAVLVDYQCVRYSPPAFDLTSFLYLTTTREFREAHEQEVLSHYYSIFRKSLDTASELRLKEMGYDKEEFLSWCERSRMFSLFYAISIFPYVLMAPGAAAAAFDDPATYDRYMNEDRSAPVLQYGQQEPVYLRRQIDATEEFVDRYILNNIK